MAEIRVLGSANRSMQRLGYLKRLVRRVTSLSTSNLENLGTDLTSTVTRKVRVTLTPARVAYIRKRLYDRVYSGLKKQAAAWSENDEIVVAMELQDLYLADPGMPSQTGKLVDADWRQYPGLSVALGLVRGGTYSANTRSLSFLDLVTADELQAFLEYKPDANPLFISRKQALLLLYSLLENDGEIVVPLLCQLAMDLADGFSERDAGDRLPGIYRATINRHRKRLLPAADRDRLEVLSRVADSIEKQRGQQYTGGSSREHSIRVRLEPYVDMGILSKPDPVHYSYVFTETGSVWTEVLQEVSTDSKVSDFLAHHFFATAGRAWKLDWQVCSEPYAVVSHLYGAWQAIQSSGGYAPIEELALLAGIRALLEHGLVIEPSVAHEAILAYQKENPYKVRFTVNRMGVLAHARFLEPPAEAQDSVEQ